MQNGIITNLDNIVRLGPQYNVAYWVDSQRYCYILKNRNMKYK